MKTHEQHLYRAGSLVYTRPQLIALFFWLLWGDFCFMLMEAVIPSVLPLKLKDLGATNVTVGIILTSIPMLLNLANPVISFKSDRFRSRWGRRIPFLVFFMPLVVLSLLAVGYSDRLGFVFYHHFQHLLGEASPNTVALVAIGITMVFFSLFNILGTTSFWYLFNDVVPEHHMARFMAWFRMVSMGSVALYNYFIFRYAETHYTFIFIGAAVIYSVGFLLMCLKVKEGTYPPPAPYQNGGHGIKAAVQTYAKESLGMTHYWFVFLSSACCVSAFGVVGPFQIYLYRSTGMSLEQIGHIAGYGNLATAATMFITGWLADRFHPIRVVIAGLIAQILVVTPVSLIWFFGRPAPEYAYQFWLLISVGLAAPAGASISMNDPPMFMRILPRSRYGQYCSANALIRSLVMIIAGIGVGVFLDQMKWLVGEERAYCLLPLWSGVLCACMLVFILLLFRSWKKHGGDEHYAAPLLDGGNESHDDGPTPAKGPGLGSKGHTWMALSQGLTHLTSIRKTTPMRSIYMSAKLLACCLALSSTVCAQEIETVKPQDTGVALVNPAMGWTMHFYSNLPRNYGSDLAPSDTLEYFPGVSTVYLRLPWAYLEPEEGKYNWAILDTPAQRWIARGKRIALRLTTSENWMKYATPEWVKNAGAKGTFYEFGKGRVPQSNTWDPIFNDPIYLQKLDAFLAAAAKRYDGNPNVEFIDVGTYGMWGEGHTHASSQQDNIDIQKLHIDLHLKHFKKTLLCISDDFAGHDKPGKKFPITDYALSKGVSLRDDSILVQPPPSSWLHAEMAQAFWPKLPVIPEHEHYGGSVERKAWKGELLLKSVEDYHASFMSIHWWPEILLKENKDVINAINLRMGYRLMPVSVTWPKTVPIATAQEAYITYGDVSGRSDTNKSFKVQWSWVNKGVAPCYPGGFPALTIKDAKGGIVSVLVDESLDMRDLKVGEPGKAPVAEHESEFIVGLFAPTTKPGSYDLFISVGSRDGTPQIALPLAADDGQHRYRLGTVTLKDN